MIQNVLILLMTIGGLMLACFDFNIKFDDLFLTTLFNCYIRTLFKYSNLNFPSSITYFATSLN
jgi:hypothetical protein